MAVVQSTRLALKNILFATDFSACADAALPYAAALARHFGSKIWLAHVLQEEPRLGIPLDSLPDVYDDAHNRAEREMSRVMRSDLLKGIPTESVMRRGAAAEVLDRVMESQKADLLVIGTHGRTGLRMLVLGSVAEAVLRRARIPVLIVGPAAAARPPEGGEIKKIVYATDFGGDSLAALPFALSLAQEDQAHLTLLHAVERSTADYAGDIERVAVYLRDNLKGLLPPDADLWCEPELVVEIGAPAEAIVHVACYQHADLIVMGAKPAGSPAAVATHSPWHTVHSVIAHAPCPVLTVRA